MIHIYIYITLHRRKIYNINNFSMSQHKKKPHFQLEKEFLDTQELKGGPLEGIVVIDVCRAVAGPNCTKLLLDLGCRVIKCENVGSDSLRRDRPYYAQMNGGKESIKIDFKNENDMALFHRLVGKADILVENFRPGVTKKLGISYEDLHDEYPRLIYGSVSGYGQSGPDSKKPAMDIIIQASSGLMAVSGFNDKPPTGLGAVPADISSGITAALGIVTALYERDRSGIGRHVDVAMADVCLTMMPNSIPRYARTGDPIAIQKQGAAGHSVAPFDVFKCKDEYLALIGYQQHHWKICNKLLGIEHITEDPRFIDNKARISNVHLLKVEWEKALARKNVAEWIEIFEANGIACGPVKTIDQVLQSRQFRERKMFTTVKDEDGKDSLGFGLPIKISGYKDSQKRKGVSSLDADRESIIRSLL